MTASEHLLGTDMTGCGGDGGVQTVSSIDAHASTTRCAGGAPDVAGVGAADVAGVGAAGTGVAADTGVAAGAADVGAAGTGVTILRGRPRPRFGEGSSLGEGWRFIVEF